MHTITFHKQEDAPHNQFGERLLSPNLCVLLYVRCVRECVCVRTPIDLNDLYERILVRVTRQHALRPLAAVLSN